MILLVPLSSVTIEERSSKARLGFVIFHSRGECICLEASVISHACFLLMLRLNDTEQLSSGSAPCDHELSFTVICASMQALHSDCCLALSLLTLSQSCIISNEHFPFSSERASCCV